MDFSLILASRQRTHLLSGLIESIRFLTSDLSKIEMLIAYDHDDTETKDAIPHFQSRYGSWVKFIGRDRSPYLNRDYLNWLYQFTTGKYLVVLNDDTDFRTHHWDKVALEKLEAFLVDKPDGVVYAAPADSLHAEEGHNRVGGIEYSCFPIVSRPAVEAVGWVLPPYFASWGADIALLRIYKEVNRFMPLPEVWINHISYHTKQRDRDETSHNVETVTKLTPLSPLICDIREDVDRLAEYLEMNKANPQ